MKRYIVVHHSTTADGKFNDWGAICKYHSSWRRMDRCEIIPGGKEEAEQLRRAGVPVEAPWKPPCGYHRGLERENGIVYERLGRELDVIGSHATGFNSSGVGLCVVGNFDVAPPDEELWRYIVREVAKLVREMGQDVREMVYEKRVLGHRETYPLLGKPVAKTCPGKLFDMDKLRQNLLALGE